MGKANDKETKVFMIVSMEAYEGEVFWNIFNGWRNEVRQAAVYRDHAEAYKEYIKVRKKYNSLRDPVYIVSLLVI